MQASVKAWTSFPSLPFPAHLGPPKELIKLQGDPYPYRRMYGRASEVKAWDGMGCDGMGWEE